MDRNFIRESGGSRKDWDSIKRDCSQPLITIITSTYNAAKDLHWTGDSIRRQSYPFIQWIIADGGSVDGTIEALQEYLDIIDLWFSEPDSGIYEAWNKALRYAKGDWVQFLGAGDELAEESALADIAPILSEAYPCCELVYGKLQYITELERRPLDCVGDPWVEMKDKWALFRPKLPPHPAVFHHKSMFCEDAPFDSRFKIAGDSYFLMKSIKNRDPYYVDILITKMVTNGVSGRLTSSVCLFYETKLVSRELGYNPPLHHKIFEYFLLVMKIFVIKFLPKNIAYRVADTFRLISGKKPKWSIK